MLAPQVCWLLKLLEWIFKDLERRSEAQHGGGAGGGGGEGSLRSSLVDGGEEYVGGLPQPRRRYTATSKSSVSGQSDALVVKVMHEWSK